jgi:uncharacterized membrane protein (UPF0127 family)
MASEVRPAQSAYRRMKGLIGCSHKAFQPGMGLWIVPSTGIHTFGMSFPIDVVYLDSAQHVIRTYRCLRPFRIGALMLKARSILELPAGMLAQTHTEVGDALEFQLNNVMKKR